MDVDVNFAGLVGSGGGDGIGFGKVGFVEGGFDCFVWFDGAAASNVLVLVLIIPGLTSSDAGVGEGGVTRASGR